MSEWTWILEEETDLVEEKIIEIEILAGEIEDQIEETEILGEEMEILIGIILEEDLVEEEDFK